jgi:hypothetical protein
MSEKTLNLGMFKIFSGFTIVTDEINALQWDHFFLTITDTTE